MAGLVPSPTDDLAEACGSAEFSIAGICSVPPVSSNVIAILKVPSTITTTLAPTSSERIFEVIVDVSPALLPDFFAGPRPAFSGGGAAAAAWAARRAAAMKLDVLTGSRGVGGISRIALSEAAMRSEG